MTENKAPKIGGILLAAGGSTRFGSPKQLAIYQGKTLIRRAAETLVSSGTHPNVAVLGAETEGSTQQLEGLEINTCINKNWHSGMSSSIRSGLKHLLSLEPNLDAVLITLCDQPLITPESLQLLTTHFQTSPTPIVVAKYGDTIGVPALFLSTLFNELLELEGDKGARRLIKNCVDRIEVEICSAIQDIDVPEDAR